MNIQAKRKTNRVRASFIVCIKSLNIENVLKDTCLKATFKRDATRCRAAPRRAAPRSATPRNATPRRERRACRSPLAAPRCAIDDYR